MSRCCYGQVHSHIMWIMLCIATLEVSTIKRFLDEDKALTYKYIDYHRL